jgi:hypothetical protein
MTARCRAECAMTWERGHLARGIGGAASCRADPIVAGWKPALLGEGRTSSLPPRAVSPRSQGRVPSFQPLELSN